MNLAELAEKSGVSIGLISQIERDLVAPSVVSLYHIAQALGTDISYFFSTSAPHYVIQRKGTHEIITTNSGFDEHLMLSPDAPTVRWTSWCLPSKAVRPMTGRASPTRERSIAMYFPGN